MESCHPNHGVAAREVARVHELAVRLRLLLRTVEPRDAAVIALSDEIMAASEIAGAALSTTDRPAVPPFPTTPVAAEREDSSKTTGDAPLSTRKDRKKRKYSQSFTTPAPYDDGHLWRKYGEKKISKAKFPRNYFRCSHRDEQGCPARKQVQQLDCTDLPLFTVAYANRHTCRPDPRPPAMHGAEPPARAPSSSPASSASSRCVASPPPSRGSGAELATTEAASQVLDESCRSARGGGGGSGGLMDEVLEPLPYGIVGFEFDDLDFFSDAW